MGEQTILCGMLQTGSILCFDKMVEKGIDGLCLQAHPVRLGDHHRRPQARRHHQHDGSPEQPGEAARFYLAEELKRSCTPLYEKHQDDIMTGISPGP
jgi:ketol-acid reductoisomerase